MKIVKKKLAIALGPGATYLEVTPLLYIFSSMYDIDFICPDWIP